MRYIIADIHGCYNEYINLLKKIKFTDKDTLYILGDVVDRGPEPIKILQDMMKRKNVVRFIGNHEFMMYTILKKLTVEMICTPKVRHFWRCIFLWQRKDKNIENTRQNSNYLL